MNNPIFGPTLASLASAQEWGRRNGAHLRFIEVMPLYFELAPIYDVPVQDALGQASWETNWGKYTGQVPPEYHNWCGLKTATATGDLPTDHDQFPTNRIGVEAHLQHIWAYGYGGQRPIPAGRTLYDERFGMVRKTAHTFRELGGSWAPSPTYGERIETRADGITKDIAMSAQLPGFQWHPARAGSNYTPGRRVPIRGGAQHYTAGVDSLRELTVSARGVSATVLIRRNATMDFRGWQLVRLEDTAHTTAYANDYTASIEYEHLASQDIPEMDYEVMSQTWVDMARYVKEHSLGEIPLVRIQGNPKRGIGGHKEWVPGSTVCPDGVDVDRVVRRAQQIANEGGGGGDMPIDFTQVQTMPDPWGDSNPYGRFWIPVPFVAAIDNDFNKVGYCVTGAFVDGPQFVQYFERARIEMHEDGGAITFGLVGLDALARYHPEMMP